MTKQCLRCGKIFIAKPKHKVYCCRNCKSTESHKRLKTGWYKGSLESHLVKKEKCQFCGFVPVHSIQLEIDHIDGNHKNNDLTNLQVLCANCHRLKTFINKDWQPKCLRPFLK